MSTVYLNGEFMPLDKARISPLDRGFLFGDGVYEVIPVYQGKCFLLEEHFLRLTNSLNAIRITPPLTHEAWQHIFNRLIADNGPDQSLYLQITRGPAQKRTHQFPKEVTPTVFVMSGPPVKVNEQGIKAITAPDIRWKNCNIKSLNLLANVLHRQDAEEKGADEGIFIRDGHVTEGCLSNIFVIKNGVIITHPTEPGILPGITRQLIADLAEKHDVPFVQRNIPQAELFSADEVWSTSVGKEITPVIQIDDQPIGAGKPGPVWQKMYDYYQAAKTS